MRPSRLSGTPRAHELARGLAGLLLAAILVIGLPVLLWTAVGWPLPHTIPSPDALRDAMLHGSISDQVVVNGLAQLTWLAWAQFLVCLIAETRAALKGRLPGRVPLATWGAQALAARLVAAVLLLAPVASSPRPAIVAMPVVAHATTTHLFDPNNSAPDGASDAPHTEPAPATGSVQHVVQPKETLWDIAERYYGDGRLYRQIFESNEGRLQPDGRRLTNSNRIYPGWVLVVADTVGEPVPDGHDHVQTPEEGHDGGVPRRAVPAPPSGSDGTEPSRTTRQPGPSRDVDHPAEHPHQPTVRLPSGSLIGLSLAIALASALALALLHRRRRYRPSPPRPGLLEDDPLLTPDVRRICHAARPAEDDEDEGDEGEPSVLVPLRRARRARGPQDRSVSQPPLQAVNVGVRDGAEVAVDLAASGGLGLVGPAAHATVRALIAATLAAGRAHAAEVLLAGNDLAAELLPGVAGFPGLTLATDLAAALSRLEIELLYRTRLLDGDEASDIATFAATHPAEPLPLLLLITRSPAPALQHRLTAVTMLGRHLGVGVVLLGASPNGPTVEVAADGHVERIDPPDALPELADAWLYTLRKDEAAQVLAVIAAASDAAPTSEPAEAAAASPHADAMAELGTTTSGVRPFEVRMLGPLRIDALGVELRTGLRSKAREVLAFLLIHPDGVTTDELVEAIWPDADPERGTQRFRTTLGNLRSTLKLASGRPDIAVVEWTGSHYRIQADLFDCDLWRLEAALHDAATADDPMAQTIALERALATRQGDLLEGNGAIWIQAPREDFRRRALNALVQLAELRQQNGNPASAIAALEQAITIDPYGEDLYRKLMRLHADLGRPDAIQRTLERLQARLEELDVDPDEATTELAHQLLTRTTVGRDPTP
jgi:DNA-binding SARP family transcriptional activator